MHDPCYDYAYGQGGSALGPEFKSVAQATLTWSVGKWTSALTGIRYGSLPNNAVYSNPTEYSTPSARLLPPWFLYNATVKYDITPDVSVTGTVNNLFNKMPPVDDTQSSWPYYDYGAYNVFGREYLVDVDVHFR